MAKIYKLGTNWHRRRQIGRKSLTIWRILAINPLARAAAPGRGGVTFGTEIIIFAPQKTYKTVKKSKIIILLAAAALLLGLAGCTQSGTGDVVYRLELDDSETEEYNGSATHDAKKVYDDLASQISSFKASYVKTWKESALDGDYSLTDAEAEKQYNSALAALRDIESSAFKQIGALPSDTHDSFKFVLKLSLVSVTSDMGEQVLESKTITISCPQS